MTTALLTVHCYGRLRWSSRPTELERGTSLGYRVDLNRAERAELLQLPGVGENLAARIEEHRREKGPFRSVDELTDVHGVGTATLERLRPWVRVEEDSSSAKPTPTFRKRSDNKKATGLLAPIDLNRATLEELRSLPGIGPVRAQAILEERRKRPFQSVDELTRVKGIKEKLLEQVRPYVTVGQVKESMAAEES
jgi:competence protein ComEA